MSRAPVCAGVRFLHLRGVQMKQLLLLAVALVLAVLLTLLWMDAAGGVGGIWVATRRRLM